VMVVHQRVGIAVFQLVALVTQHRQGGVVDENAVASVIGAPYPFAQALQQGFLLHLHAAVLLQQALVVALALPCPPRQRGGQHGQAAAEHAGRQHGLGLAGGVTGRRQQQRGTESGRAVHGSITSGKSGV